MSDQTTDPTPTTDEVNDLLAELQREIAALEPADGETDHDTTEISQAINDIAGLYHPPVDVAAAIDELLAGDTTINQAQRTKLLKVARAALTERRYRHGLLEPLLIRSRQTRKLDTQTIAAKIGVDAAQVADIEAGTRALNRIPPAAVAAWIDELELNADEAIKALEASLMTAAGAYGADRRKTTATARSYVSDVKRELDVRHKRA